VTGLWTNDRAGLAAWLSGYLRGFRISDADDCGAKGADALISMRVVQVLDPDDTELVERVADAIFNVWQDGEKSWPGDAARAVIEALRQP
jgi:hypothetical protein